MELGGSALDRNDLGEQRLKHANTHHISTVIEWSPNNASAYFSDTRIVRKGDDIASLEVSPSNGTATMVAISRRTVFVKPVRVPNSSEAEIRQILRIQLDQLFPVQQGELAYDLWLTSNVTDEGRLAVVCGIKADILRDLEAQLAKASIRAAKVLPACLGSVLLARRLGQKDCAIVGLNTDGIAIDIVSGGELLYSRIVPNENGKSDVAAEVARTFAIAGVDPLPVVTAGGMNLPGADLQSNESTLSTLASAQASGLNVNLEPPEAAVLRKSKKVNSRLRLGAFLTAAAVLLWVGILLNLSNQAQALSKDEAKWQISLEKLKNTEQRTESDRSKANKVLAALHIGFEPAQKFSDVLAAVGSHTPTSVWLTGLNLERGKQFTFRGISLSNDNVSKMLHNMAQDKRFRDVKLVFANNGLIEASPIVQFSVSSHIVGNLPLSEKDKNKRKK
jgi:Tfp pilus assembly protein PilN